MKYHYIVISDHQKPQEENEINLRYSKINSEWEDSKYNTDYRKVKYYSELESGINSLAFNDNVFRHFGSQIKSSWKFQIDKINYLLNNLAIEKGILYLIESQPTQSIEVITDYSMLVNAELNFTPVYLNWLSNSIAEIIHVFKGNFKKCMILDLDNTLWGGIIGDDGLENI